MNTGETQCRMSPNISIGDRKRLPALLRQPQLAVSGGRENLTHLVLYKKTAPAFIERLDTEAVAWCCASTWTSLASSRRTTSTRPFSRCRLRTSGCFVSRPATVDDDSETGIGVTLLADRHRPLPSGLPVRHLLGRHQPVASTSPSSRASRAVLRASRCNSTTPTSTCTAV